MRSMLAMTVEGGAAPPVATSMVRSKRRFTASGACTSMLSTMGAPHMCVTPWRSIAREDLRRLDAAQAHMRARHRRHRPRMGPAVAVEHRQGPEIDGFGRKPERHDVAERVQERAAMVIDDALGIAGRARGVVERDRLPLVGRHLPRRIGIAGGEERLVIHLAQQFAAGGVERIVDVDDGGRPPLGKSRADGAGEFAVGDQHLAFGVAQDEGDGARRRADS